VRTIAERFKPARIVIFGSWARGGAGPTSDLDLLVIMKTNLPRYKRATPIRMLFDPTPCPMDILVFTPEEVERWNGTVNHIVTEALAEGVVAYEG
jgi:predicted nucleotidyltransferase